MLVFTRKEGEEFSMTCADGTVIRIKTLEIIGRHVRYGIDAPKSVDILRDNAKVTEEKPG